MKRILITLNEDEANQLEQLAKKRKLPLAAMGRIFLVDGMKITRASHRIVLSPTPDDPIKQNIPNATVTCGDMKGVVWKTQLKGVGEKLVYPPKCIALRSDGKEIKGGLWIVTMSDAIGYTQGVVFKGGLPNSPRVLRAGDYLYFYFQSKEKLDSDKTNILIEVEPNEI